jgi:DNA-binding FadR family transcriptional regulator
MQNNSIFTDKQSALIEFVLRLAKEGKKKMPSIKRIGSELGMSNTSVREQIELAKNLGLIDVQPKKGISILPYDFSPVIIKSIYYAVNYDSDYFNQFSDVRNQLEKSFFIQSVSLLSDSDINELGATIERANEKLSESRIKIPHEEHRSFHMMIYRRLNNIFVNGLLRTYWDVYELVGLNHYLDLTYLKEVWKYHQRIHESIVAGDFSKAHRVLDDHMKLIYMRDVPNFKESKNGN